MVIKMKSNYTTKQLDETADNVLCKFQSLGYSVEMKKNFICGKFGYIFIFDGGKSYMTGYDSKDTCMQKLLDLYKNADDVVNLYGVK